MSKLRNAGMVAGTSLALAISGCHESKPPNAEKFPGQKPGTTQKSGKDCKVEKFDLGLNEAKIIYSNPNKYRLRNILRIQNLGVEYVQFKGSERMKPTKNTVEIREAAGTASEKNAPPSGVIAGDYVDNYESVSNESMVGGTYKIEVGPSSSTTDSKDVVEIQAQLCGTPDRTLKSFKSFDLPEEGEQPEIQPPQNEFSEAI